MAVGNIPSVGSINGTAGQLAIDLREWAHRAQIFHSAIGAMGADDPSRATALVGLGFAPADATEMVYLANVINTVAAVYYGTAEQTPPFSFDNALSPLWGPR
jgi:Holliday junction resolvasome RuvABC DNA-binding subunit